MRRSLRLPLIIIVIIAVLLIVLHLALPVIVRNVLNDKMANMGSYSGHVEDVDITWWRGTYRLDGLMIEKTTDQAKVPFVEAPTIDIGVSWRSLFNDGALVADVTLESPEVNFVDSPNDTEDQTGEGVGWRDKLRELMPIRLDTVQINKGALHFRNFASEPPVNVYANEIDLTIHNLSNAADPEGSRDANLQGKALFLAHAPLEVSAEFDPLVQMDDFNLQLRITDVELTRLNDLARSYGNFDFKAGTGDLVTEVDVNDSQVNGYIKPLLHNAEVFDWEQDVEQQNKGFWRTVWEGVVGATESVLQNQPKDQFATRVELDGSLKDTDISPFQAFVAILRNAFVQAFQPSFERSGDSEQG